MDDQISSLYSRVTTMMTEKSATDSIIKRAVHQLSESHLWSMSSMIGCDEQLLDRSDGQNQSIDGVTTSVAQLSGHDLATRLEECVGHICRDITSFRRNFESLQKDVTSFETMIRSDEVAAADLVTDLPEGIFNSRMLSPSDKLRSKFPTTSVSGIASTLSILFQHSVKCLEIRLVAIKEITSNMTHRQINTEKTCDDKISELERNHDDNIEALQVRYNNMQRLLNWLVV